VIHWPRLGPYHIARLRGAHELFAGKGAEVVALEIAGSDRTYGWKKEEGGTPFRRVTVFPDRYYDDLNESELHQGIFQALDALDPEAVAINGYAFMDSRACLAWCQSRKRKAILMTETTSADKPRRVLREFAKRIVVRRFSVAVCGGKLHRDYLLSLGMPAYRIFMKYDVVDNEYFARGAEQASEESSLPGLADPRPFFLASSRFIPRKNFAGLLTAYAKYRKPTAASGGWRLVLLGSGEEEELLQAKVAAETIPDVTFAGFRQIDDLPSYYKRAGCFIHPALGEPWGLVVNEAMASGLPVIVSSAVGCVKDLVDDGRNGFVFDPRNPTALAEAMETVSRDPELRQRMSERSKEIISHWTPYEFAKSLWAASEVPDDLYRIVYFGNRKIVAYREENPAGKLEQIRRIATFTLRRRLTLGIVKAAMATGADRLWFRKTTLDDPALVSAQITQALRQVGEHLKREDVGYTFTWPSEAKRQRTYAYASDHAGTVCAFIKLSEAGEEKSLGNGFKTLQALSGITHPRYKFPHPLTFGSFGNTCYHVTECVLCDPRKSRSRLENVSPEECIESYGGAIESVGPAELRRRPWMEAFWRTINEKSHFAQVIKEDQSLGAKCRRVHGDLTIANLISAEDGIWIIDWELSDSMGPCLTDVVTFFLGQRQRDLVKRPAWTLQQFRNRFIENHSQSERRDARFALAFLYGVNSGLGKRLVNAWNRARK
jgi:glycosyltransferase involved in cell wall biosynthesis